MHLCDIFEFGYFFQKIRHSALPTGKHYEARLTAEESHKLPLPPDVVQEEIVPVLKIPEVYARIKKFLASEDEDKFLLFGPEPKGAELEDAEQVFSEMWKYADAGHNPPIMMKLEKFICMLKSNTFESDARAELLREPFVYFQMACDYHEEKEAVQHCALAK